MPLRISNIVERNTFDMNVPAVALVANTAKDVLPDIRNTVEEIVARYIFNAGAANIYYRYGEDCDTVSNFNAWIAPGQMLNVETRQRVSCVSTQNGTASITQIKRDDLIQPGKNIQNTGNPQP